ncbi:hypothetical protein [Alloalcanivorax gelatiniphagus]|mgnify:CR=1 FL=1|uniref:Uncharacterized protein n=1 Tax=Alloalcanivorax gelatiniphagus TaxID=1194167 RepID=A0ABY2XL00_9GAMM|nr:hypothetical protein [Alloalcanivorax gelatiniphagus]TMW12153.1 hypothetical protein FGS76_11715 [Alloalcanivorax gelatiniphagus]|tara:strand:+ start:8496 stop:8888 length:393 start_codon:yes stop_codon:yes gene_type:complete
MQLSKISHRNTWQAVCECTHLVRKGVLDPALTAWLAARGVAVNDSVFALVCRCDERMYTGTLVDGGGRVLEYLVNLDDSSDDTLDDVTAALGPKCPTHPRTDPRDPVTMALMIQRGLAPSAEPLPEPAIA